MDNGELILLCFIFLIILIYIASYCRESAIIISSLGALIAYLWNMKKNKFESPSNGCVNYDNGSKEEEDGLRLLGIEQKSPKEGYLDYNQNLLSDYSSEPYMVEPSIIRLDAELLRDGKPIHDKAMLAKLKQNTLTHKDLDLTYPGAIVLDQLESDDYALMGHIDASEQKNAFHMKGDVTFDLNRTKTDDDIPTEWSNSAVLDGDEQIVNLARSKALNANVRADMGTINRKNFMDRFVATELDEVQDREWWGRADY